MKIHWALHDYRRIPISAIAEVTITYNIPLVDISVFDKNDEVVILREYKVFFMADEQVLKYILDICRL